MNYEVKVLNINKLPMQTFALRFFYSNLYLSDYSLSFSFIPYLNRSVQILVNEKASSYHKRHC